MKMKQVLEEAGIMYEMTNLTKEITGVDPVIFCSPKGDANHECRVKVSNILGKMSASDTFSIDLKTLNVIGYCKLNQDQLESVKWWVHKNRFTILDFWKDKINTKEFINSIKDIKEKE